MTAEMKVDKLINDLKSVKNTARLSNPYLNELPCENLRKYLKYFINNPPKCLLVAEAPGWKGCTKTGVPFTDEYHFTRNGKQGCEPLKDFSEENILEEDKHNPFMEDAARDVWRELVENKFYPLMWNIVPFHPIGNSDPTKEEIGKYRHFTDDLKAIFPTIKVTVAVGRNAEKGLKEGGSFFIHIPYPKYKGLAEFKEKIKEFAVKFR